MPGSPVDFAQRELGVREGRDDARIIEYLGGDPSEIGLNWCAAFVLWCCEQAGTPLPGNRWQNRAVHHLQRNLENAGYRLKGPNQGALFIVSRREREDPDPSVILLDGGEPGHIGFVWRNVPAGVTGFWSIEGNLRDMVTRRFWPLPHREIRAFYATEGAPRSGSGRSG